MRKCLVAICFLSALTCWSQTSQLYQEITKIIQFDADLSYDLTPGFVIGVLDGDSTYILTFGKNASDRGKEMNADAIFETGSVTKSITSLLIYALVQDSRIKLKDPVNRYLPAEFQNPRLNQLTILDLLNHSAPFPKRPSWFGEYEEDPQNPYAYYGKQDLLKFYAGFVPPKMTPEFNYTHVNYALLELVIEASTGLHFEDALSEYVLRPLAMSHSFIDFKEKKSDVLTAGIDRSLSAAEPWRFASFAASEGFKSSAHDLLQMAKAVMGNSYSRLDGLGKDILSLEKPSYNEKLFYTSGWHGIKINKKNRAFINTGNTNGHSAFIGMVPENKNAVVVLSNSAYGTKDLGLLVLRMVNYNWKRKPQ